MEQSFNSALRIVAATTLVVVVAFTAWHVAEQPRIETVESAPATEPMQGADVPANKSSAAPDSAIVTDTLPTQPDPAIANDGPSADAAPPQAANAEPTPATDGPRYANAAPDKSPRGKAEPQARSAPAARKPTSDQTVMHVRRLQTQLMVGALSCGRPRMQHNYNSFVSKFDRALKANGQQLKSYFVSRFGARGIAEMDAFLTKLSNELSLVSMRHSEFCERTDGLFDTVLALPAGEIETFADRYMLQAVASRGF